MADPLSIIASVIAVVGAGRKVCKLGKQLYRCCKVPDKLLDALNEVEDTGLVLNTVEGTLRIISDDGDLSNPVVRNAINTVNVIASRFADHVARLQTLLEERVDIGSKSSSSAITRVRKVAKRTQQELSNQLDQLQEDMRQCRNSLVCALGALGNVQHHRTRLDIRHLSFQVAQLSAVGKINSSKRFLLRDSPQNAIEGFLEVEVAPAGSSETCSPMCSCKCHSKCLVSTPLWLQATIGTLFCNYAGIPIFSPRLCTNPDCKKRETPSVQFTYFFPGWAFARAILLSLTADKLTGSGTTISLQMPQLTPHDSPAWKMIKSGDIQSIQTLFNDGLASTCDIDTHGRSLLHEAVFRLEVDICRYLISKGAKFTHKDNDGWSPADAICQQFFIFAESQDTSPEIVHRRRAVIQMKALLGVQETLDRWGLTSIHRIVLGLDEGVLQEHMRFYHELRDKKDWQGRTPLHWAAARGNADIIRILLEYKADPSAVDLDRVTPLHLAANCSSIECVNLLLGAKADPNALSNYHSTPLHFTVRSRVMVENLRALVQNGGNLEIKDKFGQTPLVFALQNNCLGAVPELIRLGADIETKDDSGMTPVQVCIKLCLADTIELLWRHGANMSHVNETGNTVLHLAAQYADLETMKTLVHATIRGVDPWMRNAAEETAGAIFSRRCRQDPSTEKMRPQFEALVLGVEEASSDIFYDASEGK